MLRPPSHRQALALALLVTVLWSSSWVLIRWGLDGEGLPPLTFAGLRYGLAAVLLFGWLGVRQGRSAVTGVRKAEFGRLALLGLVLYAITQGAQFVAIDAQPAATSSLVLSLTPLLTAFTSRLALGETPSRFQLLGSVFVVAGAWLYFAGDLGGTTVGMVAAVVGLLANVASGLLGRAVNRRTKLTSGVVTAISMGVGAAALVVAGLIVEGVPEVSARAWWIIIWLAVVNTAFAFTLWNRSLVSLGALESAGINNTMLIQIALLGWAFLGEPLGWPELLGIAAVSTGVFMTVARRGPRVPDA